jgi:quercetin dioxygenase-like cupin family protein
MGTSRFLRRHHLDNSFRCDTIYLRQISTGKRRDPVEIDDPRRNVMKTAKLFSFVCLVMLLLVSATMAQEKTGQSEMPAPSVFSKASFPIDIQAGGYDLVSIVFDFPPGAAVPNHFHGGHTLATVLSGEITLREKGTERIIKAGSSWTESQGDVHSALNAGSTSARVAVSMLLPKGAEATTIKK